MDRIEVTDQDWKELEQLEYEVMIESIRIILRMGESVVTQKKLSRFGIPGTITGDLIFGCFLDPITETKFAVVRENCEAELKKVAGTHNSQRKLSGWFV